MFAQIMDEIRHFIAAGGQMKQESSIKTTLRMLLLYVLVLILGTVFCAVIYTIYTLCMHMIAGSGLKVFDFGYFLTGANTFFPLVVIISGIVMSLYVIRYSIRKVLPIVVIFAAYVAAWIFLIPINYSWKVKTPSLTEANMTLTSDYFRVGESGSVFYYSSIEDGLADGVCIDNQSDIEDVYTFGNVRIPKTEGYSDSLIHKSIGMPKIIEQFVAWFNIFLDITRQAWKAGFIGWLCFASISLPLASVLGLCLVSKWRMVNVLSVFMAVAGILVLNVMAYTKSFMEPAKAFVEGALSNLPVKNPLVVLMNVLIFVIFSLIGFIMYNKCRKEDKKEREDPYGRKEMA